MKYYCNVCHKEIDGDAVVYINHIEKHIIDQIKAEHPEWIEENGLCQKCVDYYRQQMKSS